MAIDKYAHEPTTEISEDLYFRWYALHEEIKEKTRELERLADCIQEEIGSAHAATINGVKVLTYRPVNRYREADLRREYPELTDAFIKPKIIDTFDMSTFVNKYPEIAKLYQSRSMRDVEIK